MDRQTTGLTATGLSCSGNAEQLVNLNTSTTRAMGKITTAVDQCLEGMVARLTVVFVDRHTGIEPFVPGIAIGQQVHRVPGISDRACIRAGILEG
jgi:hypothetical protein